MCSRFAHRANECKERSRRHCFKCGKIVHEAQDCRNTIRGSEGYVKSNAALQELESGEPPTYVWSHKEISAGCMASREYKEISLSQVDFDEPVDVEYLVLHDGRKISIVSNAGSSLWSRVHRKMPVVRGNIGSKTVDVLRDTGCIGVIVKQQHVMDDQYTGRVGLMQIVDNSFIHVPIANVQIDSPYLSGQVQALSPQDAVYGI